MCKRLCSCCLCLKGVGGCGCIVAAALVPLAVFVAAVLEAPSVVSLPAVDFANAEGLSGAAETLCHRPWLCNSQVPNGDSARMHDRLAPVYDRVNRFMSLGLDQVWRRKLVQECLDPSPGDQILDLATGSADVGLLVADELEASGRSPATVKGVDASRAMLEQGQLKANGSALQNNLLLYHGYAEDLSSLESLDSSIVGVPAGIPDESIDKIAIAFGSRHISNLKQAIREIRRVLRRPSGRVCILDSSLPDNEGQLGKLVRQIAKLLAGSAMLDTILHSPSPAEFVAALAKEGLQVQTITGFAFGTVHLYRFVQSRA